MARTRAISSWLEILICIFLLASFFILSCTKVGMLPLWTFIDYFQLISLLPVIKVKLIPYVYDIFKPALVTNLIFITFKFGFVEEERYHTKNFEYYWLFNNEAIEPLIFGGAILFCIIVASIILECTKNTNTSISIRNHLVKGSREFKYNVFIRFYMIIYLPSTLFASRYIMELFKDSPKKNNPALLLSVVVFILNLILPVVLLYKVHQRFEILMLKEAKQSFNTLLLKIDKAGRRRVNNPAFFFSRRLLTAIALTLPTENSVVFYV